jgi:hypothetical protein
MSNGVYLTITNSTNHDLTIADIHASHGKLRDHQFRKGYKFAAGKTVRIHWSQLSESHGVHAEVSFTIDAPPWCLTPSSYSGHKIKFHVSCPGSGHNDFIVGIPKPFYYSDMKWHKTGNPARQEITLKCAAVATENPTTLRLMSYNTHLAGRSATTWPGLKDRLIADFKKASIGNGGIAGAAIVAVEAMPSIPMMPTFHDHTRQSSICHQIRKLTSQPDVICFQEVWDPDYVDEMVQALVADYPFSYIVPASDRRSSDTIRHEMSHYFVPDNAVAQLAIYEGLKLIDIRSVIAGNGLLVVSKYPISSVDFESFTYNATKSKWKEDVCASKGVAYFNIALNADPTPKLVHMLTTHAATGALYPVNRILDVFEKTKLIHPLKTDHKNVFFCGDFNTHRFGDPPPKKADTVSWYESDVPQVGGRLINDLIQGLLGSYGLSDLFEPQTRETTFTAGGSEDTLGAHFDKHGRAPEEMTIDFHFSNMKAQVPGQVLRDWTFDADGHTYSLSDHYAVLSEVIVNE